MFENKETFDHNLTKHLIGKMNPLNFQFALDIYRRNKKYYGVGIKEETCGTEGTQREGKRTYKPETRHEREGTREGKETPKGEETYEKQST